MSAYIKYSSIRTWDYITITDNNKIFHLGNASKVNIANHSNDFMFVKINNNNNIIPPNGVLKLVDISGINKIEFITINAMASIESFN